MIVFYFFFFFQAEDGIRDYKVTGVQTCALPISSAGKCAAQSGLSDRHTPSQSASNRGSMGVSMMPSSRRQIMRIALPYIRLAATMGSIWRISPSVMPANTKPRSEEHTSELQSPCNLV